MIYKDCYTLPIGRFIDCLIDKDYAALVINGAHEEKELQARWEEIYDQYSELSENASYSEYVAKLNDYSRTLKRITTLIGAVAVLSVTYDENMIEALRVAGFGVIKLDTTDPVKYAEGLKALELRMNGMNALIKKIIADLETMRDNMKGKQMTRKDFVKVEAYVSKFMGFHLPKETTVAQFIEYQKQAEEIAKTQKNAK